MNPFDLTGRTALVTGANRGIGLAVAAGLAAAGADIVGASSTMTSTADDLRRAVGEHGRALGLYDVDLADPDAVREFATAVDRDHSVDILVNNAGMIRRNPALDHTLEEWADVLAVDLTAPFLLAQGIGRGMAQRGWGRIVSVGSLRLFQGGEAVIGYSAAKSGLAGLTRSLANEWGRYGVTANTVAPGYIATENTRALQEDADAYQRIVDRVPLGRWGRPEDIAGTVVYLASSAADYVTGSTILVDGGWLIR